MQIIQADSAQISVRADGTADKHYNDILNLPAFLVQLEHTRAYLESEIARLGFGSWLRVLPYSLHPSHPAVLQMPFIVDGINIEDAAANNLYPEIVAAAITAYTNIGTMWRPPAVRYFLDLDARNWVYSPSENVIYLIDYLKLDERRFSF